MYKKSTYKNGYSKDYLTKGFLEQFLDNDYLATEFVEKRIDAKLLVSRATELADEFLKEFPVEEKKTQEEDEVTPAGLSEFDIPVIDGEFD